MIKTDFHMHTCFSDGANTPEEMVLQAIKLNMDKIGFSDHSYTFFDECYCIKKEKVAEYIAEIARLKEKYKGQIEILCGVEHDYYSDYPKDNFDYLIGSVHYLKCGDEYIPLDESEEIFASAVEKYFGGDGLALAECYFETVSDVVNKTNCDIIGHFDLVSIFNKDSKFFDESDQRYINAYKSAVDKLVKTGKVFEINTRAVFKGVRKTPYPAPEICEYIAKNGGKFILSSDSHSENELMFLFDETKKEALKKGYNIVSI